MSNWTLIDPKVITVLTLLILEFGLGVETEQELINWSKSNVLTLLILEFGLGVSNATFATQFERLNPSYTGIWSRGVKFRIEP